MERATSHEAIHVSTLRVSTRNALLTLRSDAISSWLAACMMAASVEGVTESCLSYRNVSTACMTSEVTSQTVTVEEEFSRMPEVNSALKKSDPAASTTL